ncbi:MAG: nicotinate-nucleotide adenylyltransferase [Thermodesulfobacteriota bacterium]
MAPQGKRTGLFGGTFNPIHMGHLRMAEEVKEGFHLDGGICFIPAALPPHKAASKIVGAAERYELIARAIAGNPGFSISDAEIRRQGRSYTIDTVAAFQESSGRDAALYMIIGMDAYYEIETWKDYEALFDRIPFIVMPRPSESEGASRATLAAMLGHARRHVDEGYEIDAERKCLVHPQKQPVYLQPVTQLDISSSRIRSLVKAGQSIKYLVPEVVEEYILTKDLYANGTG